MKKMKLLLSTIACAGLAFSLAGCGKKDNKIVIGFTYFAPIAYKDDNNNLTGFDVELAKKVFEQIDKTNNTTTTIEFLEINWESKEALLKNGTIDLVWNGLSIDEERKKNMEISIPYLNNEQVAVIKKSDSETFNSLESLKNATCTVESGSVGEGAAEGKVKEVVACDSQLNALNRVNDGTSDCAVIDSVMAGYYTTTSSLKDNLMIVKDVTLATEQYGIAAKKGKTKLIGDINKALRDIKETEFKTLAEQYGLTDFIAVE